MLKVYKVTRLMSIDHGEWYQVGDCDYIMDDDASAIAEKIEINNMSFDQCYENISKHPYRYIKPRESFIFGKPRIEVKYRWDDVERYKKFDTISYKATFEEYSMSLSCMMKEFSADQCIAYLKERGLAACPLGTK